ncbi:restriction endonuclease subunit S [Pseudoscardovia suis]|uniref:Type I restriction-modification system, specificity subunit S n=1 Tax=Pseudoscardovia suis TaxID=987063 RepID=A0A261ERR4_9BIFI|nr:restriction endonuclease subunit S [Pseudoscardovia suis]OZG49544.1 type I restriction-modification system, specificity subunit S [Pseudoscardovia suis]PJJ69663.1 type I restriction enzyme S subunit [Pseudoscardovia suis]
MAKKNSKKTVPELRFRGFTDPWEQRQLGEVGSATSGVGFPDAEQGGTDGLPFYKVSDMNLSGNESVMSASSNYVSAEQVVKNHWKPITTVPAIIFAKVGAAVFLDRKRVAATPFLMDNNMMAYIPDGKSWDVDFCLSAFNRIRLSNLARIGALPSINASDVEQHHIALPGLPEQRLIGRFFSTLDSLIAAAERQEALLRQKKQAYLQLMFPREGETEPRLRFTGFSGEWETQQFGELYAPSREKNDGSFSAKDIISVAGMRYASREPADSSDDYMRTYNVMRVGDIAFEGHTSNEFAFGRFVENDLGDGIVSHVFVVLRPIPGRRYNLAFWKEAIHDELLMRRILARSTKRSTMMHEIVVPDFLKETVRVPSLPEQQEIGKFFTTLDSTIDIFRKRVELLKKQKSAYLQSMFI